MTEVPDRLPIHPATSHTTVAATEAARQEYRVVNEGGRREEILRTQTIADRG